jgi:isopenicillin-N N-acyltransferase-like protein
MKTTLVFVELLFASIVVFITYVIFTVQITPPTVPDIEVEERVKVGNNHYTLGPNWLKKNDHGIWEAYIEGGDYERGLIYGKLMKELCQEQERIFVNQIDDFVPNPVFQRFLQLFIGFFNSDLPDYIPLENQREIYGISQSFSDEYDYIGSKYARILNYHAAHDIGHALNDYSMVGCTSFALRGDKTSDQNLLIGRNFDFYVGDDFAKNKLVLFIKPDKGHSFVSYSWAGFTGVVSGLNVKGLSVTINASKSDLPTSAKTPISILTRRILQYASTLEEAIAIAEKYETFVSETIMISSKIDGRTILIEKSPTKMGIFDPKKENQLVCSNHYQSKAFKSDKINNVNISESDSRYRYERVIELLAENEGIDVAGAAAILRDQHGSDNDTLGMGNPRAINQLIAHHSVIIQPDELIFYVSTNDYQLGEYVGYNLNEVFNTKIKNTPLIIKEDQFVHSEHYESFKDFKEIKHKITRYITFDEELSLSSSQVKEFIQLNSESYVVYEMLARYYKKKGNENLVSKYVDLALTKVVASLKIREELTALKSTK